MDIKLLYAYVKDKSEKVPLNAFDPAPPEEWLPGFAINKNAREIKCTLWGPPEAVTFSVNKTDVWDRRYFPEPVITQKRMIEIASEGDFQRGYYDSGDAYDFPCPKPVGQIIVKCAELSGALAPEAVTRYRDGVTEIRAENNGAKLFLEFVNLMTDNAMVLRGRTEGIASPVLRLYRHRDTIEPGKCWFPVGEHKQALPFQGFDYTRDEPENGPIAPPFAGEKDGMIYIEQSFPAEHTFPDGFRYIFGAKLKNITAPAASHSGRGLGTPPSVSPERLALMEKNSFIRAYYNSHGPRYAPVAEAEGVAVDLPLPQGEFEVVFTVATSLDVGRDNGKLLAFTKNKLDLLPGFDSLVSQNAGFYRKLYDTRENGRIIYGDEEKNLAEAKRVFSSWTKEHSGTTAVEPLKFQCDNTYAWMEQDWCNWHADIHFNEAEPTAYCVQNQLDRLDIWEQILILTLDAAKKNAKDVYGMPGAFYGLSFVPLLLDEVYHAHAVWEQSMEITAQNLRVLWLCWEYSGDVSYLERIWPAYSEAARFYAAYILKEEDGFYHVFPTVVAEHWGIKKNLTHNKDSISSLCLISFCLRTASEAAVILGKETEETRRWKTLSGQMAPYPTYMTDKGMIYTDLPGNAPIEYNLTAPLYPVLLTDDISLDTPDERFDIAVRTAHTISGWRVNAAKAALALEKGTEPDQLLNSRGGCIHLFPAVPDGVSLRIQRFLAKGAFEVSATFENGTATDVTVFSRRGNPCELTLPQGTSCLRVVDETTGLESISLYTPASGRLKDKIRFDTLPGHTYLVC